MDLRLYIRDTALARWLCHGNIASPTERAILVVCLGKAYNWRIDPQLQRGK